MCRTIMESTLLFPLDQNKSDDVKDIFTVLKGPINHDGISTVGQNFHFVDGKVNEEVPIKTTQHVHKNKR